MHKFLWDFVIKMDHLISAKQPDLIIVIKKEKGRIVNFVVTLE